MQKWRISIAKLIELPLSCIKPSNSSSKLTPSQSHNLTRTGSFLHSEVIQTRENCGTCNFEGNTVKPLAWVAP